MNCPLCPRLIPARLALVSQRPNTDPNPWVDPWGDRQRYACDCGATCHNPAEHSGAATFAPRPEYTQTRDWCPWIVPGDEFKGKQVRATENPYGTYIWSPRHEEFDPPVNPILRNFRTMREARPQSSTSGDAQAWLSSISAASYGYTPPEIDHARRVLLKLAAVNLKESS